MLLWSALRSVAAVCACSHSTRAVVSNPVRIARGDLEKPSLGRCVTVESENSPLLGERVMGLCICILSRANGCMSLRCGSFIHLGRIDAKP